MSEETWNEARLIPTSGISGAEEQERRATSALLAVLGSVKEFGRAITGPLGAPAGTIRTYIEVPFALGEKRCYPDGLIRVSRGTRSWTCLVEVKTATNVLETTQLENYLDIAREQGFDALLTISNEIPPAADQHPTKIDKRKLRKVALHHLSWSQVLASAVVQKEHRGVADPDQAWILGELIRYLEHPRSGALEFEDMGPSWVPVRDSVAAGTLRVGDKAAPDVAARFDALLRYASLRLGRQLGTEVTPVVARRDHVDPAGRLQTLVASLASDGTLTGAIKIPDTVSSLHVTLDLRSGRVTCHADLEAPREGRPATRVNWLLRQLKNAPDGLRVEAHAAFARGGGTAELLKDVRENPSALLAQTQKEIKTFRLALSSPLGAKRGRGRGGAIDSVLDAVDTFYATVLGQLKAWTATPPKLRDEASVALEQMIEPELVSTSLSSQDGAEVPDTLGETREIGQLNSSSEGCDTEASDDEAPLAWQMSQTTSPDDAGDPAQEPATTDADVQVGSLVPVQVSN
jgi:hypothetical protein